jgi:PKHD-type hydroxylase
MIFSIPNVLTSEQLEEITSSLSKAEFVDGKLTAGWHAQLVKNNQQLPQGNVLGKKLQQMIKASLNQNALFQVAVRPKAIHSLLISRYDVGMSYDRHIDNALMSNSTIWRSDVSFTLFLNPLSTYEGGELVIEGVDDEKAYQLEAGSAIVYPSTTLHRVEPVKAGIRLVAAGWVQSLVREASEREILFDLDTARRTIFAKEGKTPEFDLLSKSLANLLRKWADV